MSKISEIKGSAVPITRTGAKEQINFTDISSTSQNRGNDGSAAPVLRTGAKNQIKLTDTLISSKISEIRGSAAPFTRTGTRGQIKLTNTSTSSTTTSTTRPGARGLIKPNNTSGFDSRNVTGRTLLWDLRGEIPDLFKWIEEEELKELAETNTGVVNLISLFTLDDSTSQKEEDIEEVGYEEEIPMESYNSLVKGFNKMKLVKEKN